MSDIVILSTTRTPIGAFQGGPASVPAAHLGAAAIQGAVAQAGVNPADVTDCLMGNVGFGGHAQDPVWFTTAPVQGGEARWRPRADRAAPRRDLGRSEGEDRRAV